MPLYDCMLLLKPNVKREAVMDLVIRVGKHVFRRNGVVTDMKSFGDVHLGYGIKKLDGRFYKGQLMQMTMMATPNMNKELHYLNKEDRLLRWLLVKHRDTQYGMDFLNQEDSKNELTEFHGGSIYDMAQKMDDDDDLDDDDEDDDDDEYEVDQEGSRLTGDENQR